MKKIIVLGLIITSNLTSFAQSPGGVAGTTIWAKVENNTIPTQIVFNDYSANLKPITPTNLVNSFFNYNHSKKFDGSNSKFKFLSKIETLPNATVFVVNKPNTTQPSTAAMALISTNQSITSNNNYQQFQLSTDKYVRPFPVPTPPLVPYNVNYPVAPFVESTYQRPNARVNTLVWHNYNTPSIFNSFGVSGESEVLVGSSFTNSLGTSQAFNGDIAEVIMYPEALNDNQRLRVESYLAIKYGITLQPKVDYLSSKSSIVWNKQNNDYFKNRIIGIGRDSNTSLYQRQSTSSHDLTNQLVLSRSNSILPNNYPTSNTANNISDQNFILLGDNDKTQSIDSEVINGITTMKRKWLVQNTGEEAHLFNTSLHFKPDSAITLGPNEAFWLIVDRNATNTIESDFSGSDINYYPITSFYNGYATFTNLKWGTDTTNFTQFTFGIGPKMVVNAIVQPMDCVATTGSVQINISGGAPIFSVTVTGQSPSNNNFSNAFNSVSHSFPLNNLPLGQYNVSVIDSQQNISQSTFIVSPNPEININMNNIYNLQFLPNPPIIDVSTFIQGNISDYNIEWYSSNGYFSNDIELNIASLNVGTYQLTITNNNNNCVTIKTFVVMKDETIASPKITLFPNPSKGKFETQIDLAQIEDIHLDLYDSASKLLDTKHLTGNKSYNQKYELFTTGVYFLKITSKSHSETFKIIIN